MPTIEELFDFGVYSKYGSNLDTEIESEVFLNLLTPKYSVAYNRDMGTGLLAAESRPINQTAIIRMNNDLIDSLQHYNNTTETSQERRVAVPADQIKIDTSLQSTGDVSLQLYYYRLHDLMKQRVAI